MSSALLYERFAASVWEAGVRKWSGRLVETHPRVIHIWGLTDPATKGTYEMSRALRAVITDGVSREECQ
jgi:hypothetical protein